MCSDSSLAWRVGSEPPRVAWPFEAEGVRCEFVHTSLQHHAWERNPLSVMTMCVYGRGRFHRLGLSGGKCRSVLITHFILEKAKGSWLLGFPSVPSLVLDLGGTSLFQRVTNSDLGGGRLAASLSHELRDQLCEISKRPQTFACLGKSTVHLSALLDGAVKDAEAQQQGPQ